MLMSRKTRVLDFLKQGRHLNSLVAEKEFGIKANTLCYYVYCFRKAGFNVVTNMRETYSSTKYAEYRIIRD